jgi:hypothetical protein
VREWDGDESSPSLSLSFPLQKTHNDLALDAQVGLLEQPDLDPGPGLEEAEDQVLIKGRERAGERGER